MALELIEEIPDLQVIVAPVGGGGLISGTVIAAHGKNPSVSMFGVEPFDADDTCRSLKAGKRIRIDPPQTIADGLRSTTPGELTFPILQEYVENVFTVTEAEIWEALRFLFFRLKLVVEPSGAVPVAALISGKLPDHLKRVGHRQWWEH